MGKMQVRKLKEKHKKYRNTKEKYWTELLCGLSLQTVIYLSYHVFNYSHTNERYRNHVA